MAGRSWARSRFCPKISLFILIAWPEASCFWAFSHRVHLKTILCSCFLVTQGEIIVNNYFQVCPCQNRAWQCFFSGVGWSREQRGRAAPEQSTRASPGSPMSICSILQVVFLLGLGPASTGGCLVSALTLIDIWPVLFIDGVSSSESSLGWMKPQGKGKL